MLDRSTPNWPQCRSNLLERGSSRRRDPVRYAVVAVMRMPPPIAIEMIAHVDQLLRNDQFKRSRSIGVDPLKVDQDGMLPGAANETVRPAIGGGRQPSNPLAEGRAARRHHQRFGGKGKQPNIPIKEADELVIAIVEKQANLRDVCVQQRESVLMMWLHSTMEGRSALDRRWKRKLAHAMDSGPTRPRLEARQTTERPHVLIVSDDLDLAEFLSEGLPLGGFWTSVIANGLQALEVFRLRQFDLIVVDAGMGSFDALEFLRRLRGLSSLDRTGESRSLTPAVLILNDLNEPPPSSDNDLGIAARLQPPLELEDVVRTLHDVFEAWRRRYPDTPLADSASFRAF